MATGGSDYQIPGSDSFEQPVGLDPSKLSHYQILGIRQGATTDEISKAYRQKARRYHPDKTGNDISEDWMKKLNEAKSVLLSEKREEYDEKLADEGLVLVDPAGYLPGGPQPSLQFLQFFISSMNSFEEGLIKDLENFNVVLQNELNDKTRDLPALPFTSTQTNTAPVSQKPVKVSSQLTQGPLTEVLDKMNTTLNEPQLQSLLDQKHKDISKVLEMTKCPGIKTTLLPKNNLIPIISFSNVPDKELAAFGSVFTQSNDKAIPKRSTLLSSLQSVVPYTPMQLPKTGSELQAEKCSTCERKYGLFFKAMRSCFNCKRSFCKNCPPNNVLVLKLHLDKAQPLCSQCIDQFTQSDIDEWTKSCLKFIEVGTVKSTKAAMGCLMVALCLSNSSIKPITKVARSLFHSGLPELAMPFVATVLNHSQDTRELLGAFVLSAQIFKSLADESNSEPELQWNLLLGAKDSINLALEQASCLDSGAVEIPSNYITLKKDIYDALHALKEKQENIQDCELKILCIEMESLWQKRECEELLALVLDEDSAISDSFLPAEHSTTTLALEKFVVPKNAFLERMFDEDQSAIVFFRGLLKIMKKRVSEGLVDIQTAVFSGQHQEWLREAASDIFLSILNENPFLLFPPESFNEAFNGKQLLTNGTFEGRIQLLFPKTHEITPPHDRNWPHISVTGLNMKGHTKFENAVNSQVQKGNWDEKEAAMAYADYVCACNHPAEAATCFLTAAMWLLKHLQANDSSFSLAEKYATKKLITRFLHIALKMAFVHLHPGMQLHVSRLCLGIMMQMKQFTESLGSKEDGYLISTLLEMMLYCCRFCPIWHFPSVPLSEAVLLHIKTRRFHEDFLFALQKVDANKLPMKQSELLYQLYENNLRYTCLLADPAGARTRAMETMLREKGWTWNDVANRMTSALSPRDKDGWLIQQPTLGAKMEFAELKGFSFDTDSDHPSLEIIAIKADASRGRVGLFSMEDVQTVLQLDPSDLFPIFFSLDRPDEHHRFHPFQQFRYHTEKLQKTPLLHTLFEADYLLKSFSVGSEVSAKPPFNQRPCKEGLTKNLPPHLQEAVKPVSERGDTSSNINRFWIQAEELIFQPNQNESKIKFDIGELKMRVSTHPLLPGPDGKLQDTDDETDPDSPEAKFASDLTSHYNELGLHFPMFARLRELVKLQLFGLILRDILGDMKSKAEGKGINVPTELLTDIQQDQRQHNQTRVSEILTNLNNDLPDMWPAAENPEKISSVTRDMLDSLPRHIHASYSDIRSHAITFLRERDENILSQVMNGFMRLCRNKIPKSSLQNAIRKWLTSGRNPATTTELNTLICRHIPLVTHDELKRSITEFHHQQYNIFKATVDSLTDTLPKADKNPCNWVPAALFDEEDSDSARICYGGVLIAPSIKSGSVPNLPSAHSITVRVKRTGVSFQNPPNRSLFKAPTTLSTPVDGTTSTGVNGFGVSISSQISTTQYSPKQSKHKPILSIFQKSLSPQDNTHIQSDTATAGDGGGGRSTSGGKGTGGSGSGHSTNHGSKKATYAVGAAALIVAKSVQKNETSPDEHMKESRAKSNKVPPYWFEQITRLVAPSGKTINITPHSATTSNVVYGIYSANTGRLLYIGMTKGELGKRIQAHIRDIQNGKKKTDLVKHFNTEGRSVDDLRAVVLESVPTSENLRRREMEYVVKYETKSQGLNMRYPMNKKNFEPRKK